MLEPSPTPMQLQEFLREIDADGNGEVDLWEFCVHHQKRLDGVTAADRRREVEQAFALFDADGDGYVDEQEVRRVMQTNTGSALSNPELDGMLRSLGLGSGGGRVRLDVLREHKAWR